MLKADDLNKIAKLLNVDAAGLKAAIEDKEEKDFELPTDLHTFTQAQLDSRDKNKKDEGIKVGKDIAIKDLKTEAGLEFEGKDAKVLIEKLTEKIGKEVGTPADEKVKDRDKTIGQLREALKAKDGEISTVLAKARDTELNTNLLSWTLDKKPDNLTNAEWATLLRMNNELVEENGQLYVKRDGEIVKDSKEFKPIPAKDALLSYIEERKLGKVVEDNGGQGGRGGGNKGGAPGGNGKARNMAEAQEYIKAQGWHPSGQQAMEYVSAASKGNADFFKP